MTSIVLATCLKWPELTPSDSVLANALEHIGAIVTPAPWNGDFAPFAGADMVVIRSTWDYFSVPDQFAQWLDKLSTHKAVFNPPELMRWNMGKTYLFELVEKGIAMAPLRAIDPTADAIAAAMDDLGIDKAIVKPVVGGTASGLSFIRERTPEALSAAAEKLGGPGLVQAFVPEIATLGETSIIFFTGEFSHAILKTPKSGDIRVQEDHGGVSREVSAPEWAISKAREIIAACPHEALYARIDVVIRGEEMLLMEAELVEPELFFTYCPEAADRFAAALMERM